MTALPWLARIYIGVVVAAAAVAAAGVFFVPVDPLALSVTAVLFAVLDSASTVRMRRGLLLSASFPVALAAVILVGPAGAAVVGLASVLGFPRNRPAPVKRLFNAAELAVSGACAGLAYQALGGQRMLGADDFPLVLPVVFAAAAVYSIVNAGLVAGVLHTAQGARFWEAWRTTFGSGIGAYLGYGLFGLMMAVLWSTDVGALAAVLVLLPLLVARWAFGQYAEQREAYERTVRTLVQAVETKDLYTRGHSERVARGAEMIASRIAMSEDRAELVRFAGLLHDLGKLGVPTRVLRKDGALTEQEYAAIQLHPVRGVEMVRGIAFLREAYDGIMHHHERVDGRGYPLGLSGETIPEFARVIAVADAFDSMTSTRSYRSARTTAQAMEELARCKGSHFDPAMVDAFAAAVDEQGWVAAEPPDTSGAVDAELARYDHDDPVAALPVRPRQR